MWGTSQSRNVRMIGEELVAKAYVEPLNNEDFQRLTGAARGSVTAHDEVDEYMARIVRACDRRRGIRG
jgi:hypothetical protein